MSRRRAGGAGARAGGQRDHLRYRRHLDQTRRRHGEDEVRHGRRRGDDRRDARHRAAEAEGAGHRHCLRGGEYAVRQSAKTGDVQIAMYGKSIEIINTDAEGRLVLADGLFYARQLGCTHLIDAATLTGACVVALGMINAGVFSNDDEIFETVSPPP